MLLFFVYARYSLFSLLLLLIVVVGSCLVTEKILYSEKNIYRRGESYGLGYMSYNQSNRSEKIETTQYRKTDRRSSSSNQQRSSSGAYGKGGGGPAPSPSYNSSNSRRSSLCLSRVSVFVSKVLVFTFFVLFLFLVWFVIRVCKFDFLFVVNGSDL